MSRALGSGFYPHGCLTQLDADVEVECSNAGIKGPQAIAAAQAKARAQWRPLIAENPEMTPQEFRDLRRVPSLPPPGPERLAFHDKVIAENRVRIYRTKADVLAIASRKDPEHGRAKPILNALLKTDVSSSRPVFRSWLNARIERGKR